MKSRIVTLLVFLSFGLLVRSQDRVTLTNGEVIAVKITEVREGSISYKKAENPNGPLYIIDSSTIQMIEYENGSIENFDNPSTPALPAEDVVKPRVKYSGPRVGCTMIGEGTISQYLVDRGKNPFVTQFGWQFEKRIFNSKSGISGLLEFVPLFGGLEQGLFLPSGSMLFGVRTPGGMEFALGPNLSLTGLGMVFAFGTSLHIDDVYFPINIAIVPSISNTVDQYDSATNSNKKIIEKTGVRISLLVGFNTRKH